MIYAPRCVGVTGFSHRFGGFADSERTRVKLSPLAIALSVAVRAQLGGVIGALLGIPFAGAVKVVAGELLAWRRGEDPAPVT